MNCGVESGIWWINWVSKKKLFWEWFSSVIIIKLPVSHTFQIKSYGKFFCSSYIIPLALTIYTYVNLLRVFLNVASFKLVQRVVSMSYTRTYNFWWRCVLNDIFIRYLNYLRSYFCDHPNEFVNHSTSYQFFQLWVIDWHFDKIEILKLITIPHLE